MRTVDFTLSLVSDDQRRLQAGVERRRHATLLPPTMSHAAALSATARRDGDGYVLSGIVIAKHLLDAAAKPHRQEP
jgi:hypothetical protein